MSSELEIKTMLPVQPGNISDDRAMAGKYFLDIMNDGDPVMVDGVRKILRAIWMRLTIKEASELSDAELGEAIGQWYRTMNSK